MDDEYLLRPGELLQNLWTPKLSTAGGGIPGVTRTAEDGLNAIHVREVLARSRTTSAPVTWTWSPRRCCARTASRAAPRP
jgi:hypothetical protein